MTSTAVRTPALALIGADRRIVRSTEAFRSRYEHAGVACEHSHELQLVLAGEADTAVVQAGEVSLTIEAVTDIQGRRHAMLSPPVDEHASPPEPPIYALRESLDQSPVIGWLKDLDGRYIHVNHQYTVDLNTSDDRLCGRTDAELPTRETIDGPRVQYTDDGLHEPLQLEYTIPAFESRPALVALRFVIRDAEDQPVGVCGVAAPSHDAQLARDEAVRLMRIERWIRLDPAALRAELLEEWGVGSEPPSAGEPAEHWAPEERQAAEPHHAPWPQEEGPERQDESELEIERAPDTFAASAPVASPANTELADQVARLQQELQRARAELERERGEARAAREDLEVARNEREQAREEREHARAEAERARLGAADAHGAAMVAQGELELARRGQAQATAELTDRLRDRDRQLESLHAPAALVSGLSADLQRAVASERERGDELSRALSQLLGRLAELDQALGSGGPTPPFS